ncbi:MAG: ATP-binding cassette domain-containing protein [Anaeroplasmataceae bacterium]
MLRLENIVKTYKVGDQEVKALKGLSLSFRKSEFVSILGPSGCGKTTTLNIIGGLDKYTSGDLVINGKSTSEYNDRDWDIYRNHRVGFIFQSYNLIPHQTILENVELALTIAGVSKAERIERSKKALEEVGLGNQLNKKPNQLSGGQCQRVAIARALVNDPEILLADEPTGALDTQTSIQIMELIKKISLNRLVIMVTHNPELAEQYSTRIVRLLDGQLVSDTNPYKPEDEIEEVKKSLEEEKYLITEETSNLTPKEIKKYNKNKAENAKMSFWTAFKLSARNLVSKLKRTIMVVVAGSIGIIGVSTVLAVSSGVKGYIADMQDDMLSGNPIQITKTGVNYEAMLDQSSFSDKRDILEAGDWVNVNSMIQYLTGNQDVLMNLMYNNEFDKDYINYVKSMPKEYYNAISLDYGIDVTTNIYTDFSLNTTEDYSKSETNYNKEMSLQSITSLYTSLIKELDDYKQYASVITSLTKVMSQCVNDNDYIKSQYDIVSGTLPQKENDILIVLDDKSQLTDLMLTQLGYYSQEEFFSLVYKGLGDEENFNEAVYKNRFSYEELMSKKFTWYPNDRVFSESTIPTKSFNYNYEASSEWTDGIELNICGIVKPKANISYGALSQGFLYSEDLARKMISINQNSKIANYINEHGTIQSGLYNNNPVGIYYELPYYFEREDNTYDHTDIVFVGETNQMSQMFEMMGIDLGGDFLSITSKTIAASYIPESINIYPLDFDHKNLVTDYLDKWNTTESVTFIDYDDNFNVTYVTDEHGKEIVKTKTLQYKTTILDEAGNPETDADGNVLVSTRHEIKYTDQVGLIINMMNTMIDIITYALVAFTALSLVVSTVMVGIITYVSVVERVKEIGVIRSLGGRKKDVSHLFNAETFMIGLSSGVFGIVFTALLSLIINLIVSSVSDGAVKVIADLTFPTAIIMIVLSILLTLISGLLPARSAAHKNPVDALRSE